jgi:nickel-type superoxide dismutase maturation protease
MMGLTPAMVRRAGAAAALSLVGVTLWRVVHRLEVVGTSMAPALEPGDRLVVVGMPWFPPSWPRPGHVVAVGDPRDPRRLLIKRVRAVHHDDGTLEVVGDAAEASTDSRTFGPVPRSSIVGRAVYRYAPTGRRGPLPLAGEYHRA